MRISRKGVPSMDWDGVIDGMCQGAACSHLHEGSRRGSVSAVGSSAARSVHRWRGKRPWAIMYVMKALFPVCLRSDYPPCSPALAGSMQMVGMVHGGRGAAACGCPRPPSKNISGPGMLGQYAAACGRIPCVPVSRTAATSIAWRRRGEALFQRLAAVCRFRWQVQPTKCICWRGV